MAKSYNKRDLSLQELNWSTMSKIFSYRIIADSVFDTIFQICLFWKIVFRKIWSCICIHTLPNICCVVLCSLWPCRYAANLCLPARSSFQPTKITDSLLFSIFLCSFCGIVIPSVHKHEFYEEPHHYWALSLSRDIRSPILL